VNTRRVRANPGDGAKLSGELLAAAQDLLVETGSEHALTLRAVAQRAGVTTPSVYRHFADKEALLEAVCLQVWAELDQRMRHAAEQTTDPFTAMGRRATIYVRFALDHPVQYRILMMRPGAGEKAALACQEYLTDAVADCVATGVLHGDPRRLALSLWSAVHGCASLLIVHSSFPWPVDLDTVIDDAIRAAGIGTALSSRLPRRRLPASAELAAELDTFAERLTGR
jgi:AcrR family transcriptional regulator